MPVGNVMIGRSGCGRQGQMSQRAVEKSRLGLSCVVDPFATRPNESGIRADSSFTIGIAIEN
jgi:hypothetical protein